MPNPYPCPIAGVRVYCGVQTSNPYPNPSKPHQFTPGFSIPVPISSCITRCCKARHMMETEAESFFFTKFFLQLVSLMVNLTFYYRLLSTARPVFFSYRTKKKKHQEKDKFLFYVYKNKRKNYRTAKRNIKSRSAQHRLPPHLAPTTISELSAKNGKFFFIGGVTGESKLPLMAEAGLRLGESQPKLGKLIRCITVCVGRGRRNWRRGFRRPRLPS